MIRTGLAVLVAGLLSLAGLGSLPGAAVQGREVGSAALEAGWQSTAVLDPEVRAALAAEDPMIPLIVYLRPGASASRAGAGLTVSTPQQQRSYVENLKDQLDESSDGVRPLLAEGVQAGRASAPIDLWLVNGLAVDADPGLVRELGSHPDVRRLGYNNRFRPPTTGDGPLVDPSQIDTLPWNLNTIGAQEVWDLLGIDGSGVTVAILDTGVDYNHKDLQERYRGYYGPGLDPRNPGNWWCPTALCGQGAEYPWDNDGHGTHVLGSILGETTGVAPGAQWIAAMVCTENECFDAWVILAIQWVLEGDASRTEAADVLNLSLAGSTAIDYEWKTAVDSVVRGGVVAVVASGNTGLVRTPGTFTSTITVGAMDERRDVPQWSGRGLSPWFETKPEVVAPGVGVLSTWPGGGYKHETGTSMATPHVAGLTALMLQADPTLSPEDIKAVLKQTAVPLHGAVPSDDSGWGLVNAYAAVSRLIGSGTVRGRVTGSDGAPLKWGGQVTVRRPDGTVMGARQLDATGRYTVALGAGDYLLTAEAFGYDTRTEPFSLQEGDEIALDLRLPRLTGESGFLVGSITDEAGEPVSGQVMLVDTPVVEPFESGQFAIANLPPGTYDLRVESPGHRVSRDTVTVRPGEVTQVRYGLTSAPTILLLDGDAWHFSGSGQYYAEALEALNYVFDTWRVLDRNFPKLPAPETLADYDMVIWSHNVSSPGYIKAAHLLQGYLDAGGRLIVAGQEVACTDAGQPPCGQTSMRQPYLSDRLFTQLVDHAAEADAVSGLPNTPLADISVALGGEDALEQLTPDALRATNGLHAEVVAEYDTGGGAIVMVGACLEYRAALLGFGLEGIGSLDERVALLGGLIDGLTAEMPTMVLTAVEDSAQVRPAGSHADFTVTVHSTATEPLPMRVTVSGAEWPTTLYRAGFVEPLPETVQARSCLPVDVGVRVQIPAEAGRAVSDTAKIHVDLDGGRAQDTVDLETRTPGTVLLVDGDLHLQSEDRYEEALAAAGVPYDLHVIHQDPRYPASATIPASDTLGLYPVVLWFSGYHPHGDTHLDIPTMREIAAYLSQGGRLFLSSEDLLNFRGLTAYSRDRLFRRDILGVESYTQDIGADVVAGVPGTRFASIGPCVLRPSGNSGGDFYMDQIEPAVRSEPVMKVVDGDGRLRQTVANRYVSGTMKTVFMAFDASKLSATCANSALNAALDWFSPVTESRVSADRSTYGSGDTVELTARILNNGPEDLQDVIAVWRLPPGGAPASLPTGTAWSWDGDARTVTWSGDLPRAQPVDASIDFVLDANLPRGTTHASELEIHDGHGLTVRRSANWRVNVVDLSASDKTVVPDRPLGHGDTARFTIAIRNRGTLPVGTFTVTDVLPDGLELLERTITQPSGELIEVTTGRIVWRSSVGAGGQASLSYDARVTTRRGGRLRNQAVIVDDSGQQLELSASVLVKPNLMLPWVANEALLPTR